MEKYKQILIPEQLHQTLTELKHPGQSYSGVIRELIEVSKKYQSLWKQELEKGYQNISEVDNDEVV